MKFATVEGRRASAQPGLRGECPCCRTEVIAKCGSYKIWHWACKSKGTCDPWWENETEWHRSWKARFPDDWQEIIHEDTRTGEKHIADVKTNVGMVFEFQRSSIFPEEVAARERFYPLMTWIIDGLKNEMDKANFRLSLAGQSRQEPGLFSIQWIARSKLLDRWSKSSHRIFFDFGEPHLWRLVRFDASTKKGFVAAVSKDELVKDAIAGRYGGPNHAPPAVSTRFL
jgi:competence protein CoiA